VFIGERKGPNGVQGLEIAFLLNTNFPVEEGYEETLVELQDLVGPEFTIDSGYTEHLEIWMTYLETIEGHELETLQRIQNASELAFRMATIASGIRHIPEINLR
jgi:hypothetical protein